MDTTMPERNKRPGAKRGRTPKRPSYVCMSSHAARARERSLAGDVRRENIDCETQTRSQRSECFHAPGHARFFHYKIPPDVQVFVLFFSRKLEIGWLRTDESLCNEDIALDGIETKMNAAMFSAFLVIVALLFLLLFNTCKYSEAYEFRYLCFL